MRLGGSRFVRAGIAVFVALMFFTPFAAIGTAASNQSSPSPAPVLSIGSSFHTDALGGGVPIQQGGFLTNDRHFLVFNGVITFGGGFSPVNNGTQVYAASFELVIYSLMLSPQTVPIQLIEKGTTYDQSTTVNPGVADVVTVNLQPTNSWEHAVLVVDGTEQFYTVAVPISFLPNNIANVGGLDIIALAVISESLIMLALATSAAYGVMRKALWAPKFSLLIWGHVILIGLAAAVMLDFQAVDSTFAGWSPLVYAFFLFPIFFVFALSFFNRAPSAEMLQANAPLSGRLRFNRWDLRIGRDLKGRWVIIGETWGQLFARFFGHQVPLTSSESTIIGPEPFIADLVNRRVLSKEQLLRRVRRITPEKAEALDDFDIINVTVDGRPVKSGRREPPVKLLFSPVGKPAEVEWPKLSAHKEVLVPTKLSRDGETMIPEHYKRKFTLPHYTEGRANITLHTIHFRSALSVVMGWRNADDLAQILNDTVLDLETVKAGFHTAVAQKVREKLLIRESLLGRGETDLTEEEATLESERERHEATLMELQKQFGAGLIPGKSLTPQQTEPKRKERR